MKSKSRGGIYVHVPVCRRKCLYCSFFSVGEKLIGNWNVFVDALLKELEERIEEAEGRECVTIYVGGGTPSLMPGEIMAKLLAGIKERLKTLNGNVKIGEVTIEVNPDDVSHDLAMWWKSAGVNRVSMGVQSLCDRELELIGRRHDSKTAIKAYEILNEHFDNISLDLMFGLPCQSIDSLSDTLDGFIAMKPKHISAYSLMYEERSALMRMRDSGKIEETDEDISVKMFNLINDRLRGAGYNRYEISNYSLPGYESRHNSAYWGGIPYIGLGPSAHSYDGGRIRRWNVADINDYIKGVDNNSKYFEEEVLSEAEIIEERIMTGLRTSAGIDLQKFKNDFGSRAYEDMVRKGKRIEQTGFLEIIDNHIRLTDKGVMVSDEIIVEFF